MDRPPESEWETSTFTYKPANEWDEHWVGIDVPTARRLINEFVDAFNPSNWRGLINPL